MINVYLENTSRYIEELRTAATRGDLHAFMYAIQNLQSSSANLGADRLTGLCTAVEDDIRQEKLVSLNAALAAIEVAWSEVRTALVAVQTPTITTALASTPITGLILVVDDDPNMRLLTRYILVRGGLQVVEAENGLDALDLFTKLRPDLIILDVLMPGMDGFQTCTALRQLPHGAHVPVLIMTGLNDITAVERAYQVGATDFLPKHEHSTLLEHRARYLLRSGQTLAALYRSESRLQTLSLAIEQSPTSIVITDAEGNIEYVNPCFREMTGYGQTEVLGQNMNLLKSVDTPAEVYHDLWNTITTGKIWRGEICNRRKDGQLYWAVITVSPIYNALDQTPEESTPKITHFLSIQEDVTTRRAQEERIRYLSYFDPLTTLPNRRLFQDRLVEVLSQAKRRNQLAGLLLLDLDHFKRINDTLGHQVGDQMLQHITVRLTEFVRRFDRRIAHLDDECLHALARIGEDEFALILTDITATNYVSQVAQQLLEQIAHPFNLDGHDIVFGASIGIAIYPFDGNDADTLLKNADTAMFNAKNNGRNTYRVYSHAMNDAGIRHMHLESALRRALERDEFVIHYQPQFDLHGERRLIGFEALIRWNNAEMGVIAPTEFIPIAEEHDLIIPIGAWVLENACRMAVTWQSYGPLRVAVNLSAHQLRHRKLLDTVTRALEITGLPANCLELEITESVIMQDAPATARLLAELKAVGLYLAVDDFGTGYSSLSYLKSFPIDTLKIDRSFVMDITTSSESAHIVTAIIAMGHGLGLKVIAEGVEDQQQMDFLYQQGCDFVQGYLVSRPLPAAAVYEFLDRDLNFLLPM